MLEVESTQNEKETAVIVDENATKAAMIKQQKDQQYQNQKDRTLFCVNIDEKCTEEILFELFYQAGPIENLVRKPDRNGKLICLVTYKYLESCDYAIKIFNNMQLYNQSLRVQFSQNSSQQTPKSNLNDSSNSGQRSMSRNNSSSAGLSNRGGQTRQELDQQLAASMQMPTNLPPSLMNFMQPMFMMPQAQQQQQQQQQNAFHRSRSGPNIINGFDRQDQSVRYGNSGGQWANPMGDGNYQNQQQQRNNNNNSGSWSNARQRDSSMPQNNYQQQSYHDRDRDRDYSRDRDRDRDSRRRTGTGENRRSRSRSPSNNGPNKRFRR